MKIPLSKSLKALNGVFLETFYKSTYLWYFLFAFVFLGVNVAVNTFIPLFFKILVDKLSSATFDFLGLALLGYGFLWANGKISLYFREILMNRIIERSTHVLSSQALKKLYELPHNYHLDKKTGEITNMLRRAQHNLPLILWGTTIHMLPILLEVISVIIILTQSYSFQFILILIMTISLYGFYTFLTTGLVVKLRTLSIESDKVVELKFIDWLQNIELIRTFGKTEHALHDYEATLQTKENLEVKFLNILGVIRIGQAIILGSGLSILMYFLGKSVHKGSLTVGDFVMFNGYFIQFIGPISILGYVWRDVKKALLEMKDVIDLLLLSPPPTQQTNAKLLKDNELEIEFKNVSFKYENIFILKNISFKVLSGETALIMGPSGSGKSTLLKLLLRYYDPTEGQILINGRDIKNFSLDSYRKFLGFVPQDSFMLDMTIQTNIEFFTPEFSIEDVKEAATKALISEAIERLPNQYSSLVGEKGAKLSGGEKQRIALARMFIRNPKLCILDEPTSALDEKTEKIIYQNLKNYLPHTTKIIVSHRKPPINFVDRVITLDTLTAHEQRLSF